MEKERCQHAILISLSLSLSLSLSPPSVKEQAIADIANRESIHMCEAQLSSRIHIAWQACLCTPDQHYLYPFNI